MPTDANAQAAQHSGFNLWQTLIHANFVSQMVFLVLVGCSVLSLAVIIERWIYLRKARQSIEADMELIDNWSRIQQWDVARAAIEISERETQPLLAVLRAGIVYWQELLAVGEARTEVMENMVESAVTRELKLVKTVFRLRLPILANIASTAPFIGLFGTVIGIILTFNEIASKGNLGMNVVGSGIADALVATAMGLFAAIPAVLAYNAFIDWSNQMVMMMEETALERIYFLVQRPMSGASSASTPNHAARLVVKD